MEHGTWSWCHVTLPARAHWHERRRCRRAKYFRATDARVGGHNTSSYQPPLQTVVATAVKGRLKDRLRINS
eukprot:2028988-Prymnesium_polylepis.1